jgi:hypothetical protein
MVEFVPELSSTKILILKVLQFSLKNTYISSNCAKFHVFLMCFPNEKWICLKMTNFGPKTCVTLSTHRTNFNEFFLPFLYFFRSRTSCRLKMHQICQCFITFYTGWTFSRKLSQLNRSNLLLYHPSAMPMPTMPS